MNEGAAKSVFLALLSWMGVGASVFLNHVGTLASIAAAAAAVWASRWAIRVAKATIRVRKAEEAVAATKLCEACIAGHQPPACPLTVDMRPENCPRRSEP